MVLAADTLGFGERGVLPYAQQQQLAANFFARGRSLAGFTALEDLQLAAFLAAQPQVKQGQISALGFSMGASTRVPTNCMSRCSPPVRRIPASCWRMNRAWVSRWKPA